MARSRAARLRESAPLFAALGDETRLGLVARLSEDGPLSIADLAAGAGVTRQAIAKHLGVLGDAGLVQGTRDGRKNVFQLEPRRLAEAQRLLEVISSGWDETLERLRAFVED
jgi:DNA-binding transcriptional ArsR family regulator